MTRIRTAAGLAAILSLALVTAPASAARHPKPKPKPEPTSRYTATIHCGHGPVVVVSTDDMFAPLLNRATGKRYFPVKWNVKVGDRVIKKTKPGGSFGRTVDCSYDDGEAVGTVTVLRGAHQPRRPHRHR